MRLELFILWDQLKKSPVKLSRLRGSSMEIFKNFFFNLFETQREHSKETETQAGRDLHPQVHSSAVCNSQGWAQAKAKPGS